MCAKTRTCVAQIRMLILIHSALILLKVVKCLYGYPESKFDMFTWMQEWERPAPGRRPDIFPSFSPIKPPLPQPLPGDPEEEDEDEEKEDEDPDKEPDQPEES